MKAVVTRVSGRLGVDLFHVTKNGRAVSLTSAMSALKKAHPSIDATRWKPIGLRSWSHASVFELVPAQKFRWAVTARALGRIGEESIVKGCVVEAGDPLRIDIFNLPAAAGERVTDWLAGTATSSGADGTKRGISCDCDPFHFWPVGTYYIRIEPATETV